MNVTNFSAIMILVYIQQVSGSENMLQSAASLSLHLKKSLGILSFTASDGEIEAKEKEIKAAVGEGSKVFVRQGCLADLAEFCEAEEASFLLLQLTNDKTKSIQTLLTACRGLRIPYLLFKEIFAALSLQKVLVPVTFLEEEIEKAQFASAFGRFYQSETCILQANDYGSKAATTVDKMKSLFDKFSLNYKVEKAKSDSFKLEFEAIEKAQKEGFDIVLISASREYGLDDIFFGPKERKVIRNTEIPVLLINPRGDLYALCD